MRVFPKRPGRGSARNKAFSLCQGESIQWLDADDLLAPDKIALQMGAIARCPGKRSLISGAWGHFIYRPSRTKFAPTALWRDLSPVEWLLRKLERNLFMQTATWLVSRELTEAAGPWDPRLLGDDDGEYFARVIVASKRILCEPRARVFYRRPTSVNLSYIGRSGKKLEAQLLSMQLNVRYIRSLEDSERVRAACTHYLQDWLTCFYPERLDLVKELEQIAAELGGRLEPPRMPWKYAGIQKMFGWTAAKRTQLYYNQCKASLIRGWDKALFRFERRIAGLYSGG